MAAEVASGAGARVDVYDAMPSVGRKFLMAGKGGLNLTHSEPSEAFLSRYGARRAHLAPLARRLRTRCFARLGARTRRRNLRRQFRPCVPLGHEGGAAAARLAAPPARRRREFPHAPSLACLGRGRGAAFRYAARRARRARRRRGAGAGRRQLGAARFHRRLGAAACRARRARRALAAGELRLRRRLERTLSRALRRPAGEAGGSGAYRSGRRRVAPAGRIHGHRDRRRGQPDLRPVRAPARRRSRRKAPRCCISTWRRDGTWRGCCRNYRRDAVRVRWRITCAAAPA